MEIIIHGKPNAGSANATAGIDVSLQQKIVDDFFTSMAEHEYNNALIVDARQWKKNWYSVYTYWLGANIKDTAGRPSYFALSIIVPNQYYCLVSELFNHLSSICSKYVIGKYLTSNGDYIVQDFSDDVLFKELVSKVDDKNFVNLLEQFDSAFKPQVELGNNIHYNIVDCDAKSFVEDLRNYGRVIVSEKTPSRAAMINEAKGYVNKIRNLENQVKEKDESILKLKQQIEELSGQVTDDATSGNKKITELRSKISLLQSQNKDINAKYAKLQESNELYQKQLNQIAGIVGSARTEVQETSASNKKKPSILKNIISKIDTFLLVLILILVGFTFLPKKTTNETNKEVKELKETLTQRDSEINYLKAKVDELNSSNATLASKLKAIGDLTSTTPLEETSETETITVGDVDCELQILQKSKIVDSDDVKSDVPITIVVGSKKSNYGFHTSNLADSEIAKLMNGQEFYLKKVNNRKEIIITYRTAKSENLNEDNKLVFK